MSCYTHNTTANARQAPNGPNNAHGIEQDFVDEIKQRFRRLRGLIRRTVGYKNDALALSSNADEREAFDFPTDQTKIAAFIRWLKNAVREEILEPANPSDVEAGQHWTLVYIREAFRAGVNQSTGLLFQQGASVENIPNDGILSRPFFQRDLQDLYTRTYSNLESITEDIAPVVRETLTEGFARGWNPKKMARELTSEVRSIERTRAETLARSETINAHSSATLRNYERAGVDVVGHATWKDASDTDVCAFCRRLDGVALSLEEARTGAVEWRGQVYRLQPPAHPNGRCTLLPSVGADPPTSSLSERLDASFEGVTVLPGG